MSQSDGVKLSKMTKKYFSIKPNAARLEQIKSWLKEEHEEFDSGFYCNWPSIERSFEASELCCITTHDQTLAFCTYHIVGYVAYIHNLEVHPKYRRQGIAKRLVTNLINRLVTQNAWVVEVESNPITSMPFWLSLDFRLLPKEVKTNHYEQVQNLLYKPLANSFECNIGENTDSVFELWDVDFWHAQDGSPRWSWTINSTTLAAPIIHPANRYWRLRWSLNGQMIRDCDVKSFSKDSTDWGSYVILSKLPEMNGNF